MGKTSLIAVVFLVFATSTSQAQTTHDVAVGPGFDFAPDSITIDAGDSIRWIWAGGLHNVESGTGTFDGRFTSGSPTDVVGTQFEQTFDAAFLAANPAAGNSYPYYCVVHFGFGMTGTVTVNVPVVDEFVRGDCNPDGSFNIADAINLLNFLFPSGAAPTLDCQDACDCNDDGALNLADAICLLSGLFGSPAIPPVAPHPNCGADVGVDSLECPGYAHCP